MDIIEEEPFFENEEYEQEDENDEREERIEEIEEYEKTKNSPIEKPKSKKKELIQKLNNLKKQEKL